MHLDIIKKSIRAAEMSLKMEGLKVDLECVELCKMMLKGKTSMEEYIQCVTPQAVEQ